MAPDDIPTSITQLTYRTAQALGDAGIPVLSQNQTAVFLAHFWPAIEQHIRARVGDEIEAFAKAAGRAEDPTKIGYLGGMAVSETIARGTTPDLVAMVDELLAAAAPARTGD